MVVAFIAIVIFGEFQYHKDEVYISPNQRDQLNKIIPSEYDFSSPWWRFRFRRRIWVETSVAVVLPVEALVAVALAAEPGGSW